MRLKYSTGFSICAAIGTIVVVFWPANYTLAFLLLTADAAVTVFVLLRRVIRNEVLLIFYLILSYYIFPFPANAFLGSLEPLDLTIVQTLSARGFEFPTDTILYSNLLIVFKNIFVLACGNTVVGRAATLT